MNDIPDAVWVLEKELSDGSKVWSVEIDAEEYACVDEDAANEFAESFVELVNEHTMRTAKVMYG